MEDKDKLIAELKAENDKLRNELTTYGATGVCEVCSDKANKLADKYLGCLQEIKKIANNIVYSDDMPACVNDKECPLNGGDGFDNHCNMECPFILGKQILDLITKAESEG